MRSDGALSAACIGATSVWSWTVERPLMHPSSRSSKLVSLSRSSVGNGVVTRPRRCPSRERAGFRHALANRPCPPPIWRCVPGFEGLPIHAEVGAGHLADMVGIGAVEDGKHVRHVVQMDVQALRRLQGCHSEWVDGRLLENLGEANYVAELLDDAEAHPILSTVCRRVPCAASSCRHSSMSFGEVDLQWPVCRMYSSADQGIMRSFCSVTCGFDLSSRVFAHSLEMSLRIGLESQARERNACGQSDCTARTRRRDPRHAMALA